MQKEDLEQCEEMWTFNRHKYVLTDDRDVLPNGRQMGHGIFEVADGQLMAVLFEDKSLHDEVVRRMLEAGVKVVSSPKAALELARSQQG